MFLHHRILNEDVTHRQLWVLLKNTVPKEQHMCSSGRTTQLRMLASHIRLISVSPKKPCFVTFHLMHIEYSIIKLSMWRHTKYAYTKQGCAFSLKVLRTLHAEKTSETKGFSAAIDNNCSGTAYC